MRASGKCKEERRKKKEVGIVPAALFAECINTEAKREMGRGGYWRFPRTTSPAGSNTQHRVFIPPVLSLEIKIGNNGELSAKYI